MKIRVLRRVSWEIPMLCVLFCFAVSLFNLAGYIFAAIVLGMLLVKFTKIRLNDMEMMLILFSLSYSIFHFFHNGMNLNDIIWYVFGPWTAYLYGRLFIQKSGFKNAFWALVVVLAAGMFLHGLLNWYAYCTSEHIAMYGFYRQSVDFWRGTLINVNTTAMYCTFAVGISIGLLFSPVKKGIKAACCAVLVISMVISVFYANRALLMIVGGMVAWQLFKLFISPTVQRKTKVYMIIGILLCVLLITIVIGFNIGGIADWLESLVVIQRFRKEGVSNRFIVWSYFFKDANFLSHLFGGNQMLENANVHYFHNTWLDVYHAVGIVPFVLFLIITANAFVMTISTCRCLKRHGQQTAALVLQCLMIVAAMNCAVEPVLEGNPYFFLMILMFLGAADGWCRCLNNCPAEEKL